MQQLCPGLQRQSVVRLCISGIAGVHVIVRSKLHLCVCCFVVAGVVVTDIIIIIVTRGIIDMLQPLQMGDELLGGGEAEPSHLRWMKQSVGLSR